MTAFVARPASSTGRAKTAAVRLVTVSSTTGVSRAALNSVGTSVIVALPYRADLRIHPGGSPDTPNVNGP
jgi:hypothetical protein